MKKPTYDEIVHKLSSDMIQGSNLPTEKERRAFLEKTFVDLDKLYRGQQAVSHSQYIRLVNKLSGFRGGEYNDYLDVLAGAAHLGMLDLTLQGGIPAFSPEAARQRRDIVTGITGVEPIDPDTGE